MNPVVLTEPLSRFIDEKGKSSLEKGIAKRNAFYPNRGGRTSVFRTEALLNEAIWRIGAEHVEPETHRVILARADVSAGVPISLGLRVEPDESPERHANIDGWPADKMAERMLAERLAHAATLVLRNA